MIKGNCFCGSVKFTIETPVHSCFHCHCDSCKRSHGAPFVTWASVPYSKLKFTEGEKLVKAYESSLNTYWGFCSSCGSSMLQRTHKTPAMVYVSVGVLSDAPDVRPESHMCFSEHEKWIKLNDGLPTHNEQGSQHINE